MTVLKLILSTYLLVNRLHSSFFIPLTFTPTFSTIPVCKRLVVCLERLLACCRELLLEPVADIRHKPTSGAEARGKNDRMDKDCLCHRPKPDTACRHTEMSRFEGPSTRILGRKSFCRVRQSLCLLAFLSPLFYGNTLSFPVAESKSRKR
jgi:hypothetical protein